MIRARLIDGRGTISVLVARDREERVEPMPMIGAWDRASFELHASHPADLVAMVARKLLEGRTVGLFDESGLSGGMVTRIESIATALREIEQRTFGFEWTRGDLADARIEGERGAIDWFIRSPTDLLIVGPVAFEKRAQPEVRGTYRRRRSSFAPPPRAVGADWS